MSAELWLDGARSREHQLQEAAFSLEQTTYARKCFMSINMRRGLEEMEDFFEHTCNCKESTL